jgi:hypothetical protein
MGKRSRAASRGWDSRIRRDGYRQIAKTLANRNPTVSALSSAGNILMGSYKAAYPRQYRRNKFAKRVNKYI